MILCINLSLSPYFFGLFDPADQTCHSISCSANHDFSEHFLDSLDPLLKQNNKLLTDITAIGLIQGPGAYTGLRICATIANMLHLSIGAPLYGISTFEALLYPFLQKDGTYFLIVPGRKNQVLCQLIGVKNHASQLLTAPFDLSFDQLSTKLASFNSPLSVIGYPFSPPIPDTVHYYDFPLSFYHTCLLVEEKTKLTGIGSSPFVFPEYAYQPFLGPSKKKKAGQS